MLAVVMRLAVLVLTSTLLLAFSCISGDAVETATPTAACGGEHPVDPAGGYYVCSFSDDFSGTSYDTSKWTPQDTAVTGIRSGATGCFVPSSQVLSVSDGAAHLSAVSTGAAFVCHSPTGDFSSTTMVSALTTKGHFNQTYGRFEFRARFPDTTVSGTHSALWLYPDSNAYGVWPASGEIDVAEWWSRIPDHAYPSLHYTGEVRANTTGTGCAVADPSAYHTYAVDWTPTTMWFEVDGTVCWQTAWAGLTGLSGSAPFDRPFNMVLTQVFGAGINAPTTATPDVNTMDVDWVRAFAWHEGHLGTSVTAVKPSVGSAVVRVKGR